MPALSPTRQNAVMLVVLLVAQLLLMSSSLKGSSGSTKVEGWLMRLSSPVVAAGRFVGGGFRDLAVGLGDLRTTFRRNTALEAENERLRGELERFREAASENRRLRRLLGMRQELIPGSIAASVVTSNLSGHTHMLVLDRGTADGVRPDFAVASWGGAVGRVVAVSKHHCTVRLLTDPNSGVAGVVQRSRVQGLVVGGGKAALDLLYVPRFSDVMHGDRIVTSGLDGIFPRGFGIGRVSAITETPDGTQTIHLQAELEYRRLEEVLIVLEPASGKLLSVAEPEAPR